MVNGVVEKVAGRRLQISSDTYCAPGRVERAKARAD